MKSALLYKQSEDELPARVIELRRKIKDSSYIDNAIQRMAFVMSRLLVENAQIERKL
jgi:hypothetical protein